jgi:cyclophilin family peptidyl-prolyl cis-trans isomerase
MWKWIVGALTIILTTGAITVVNAEEVAVIETKFGKIVIAFYSNDAPKTVENFKKLTKEGFYNGTLFHRCIPGFMIQGGDPLTKDAVNIDRYGTGGPSYTVEAEIKRDHKRGTLATARQGDQVNPQKRSSGSQFFINVKDNDFLNNNYTVFGEVIQGMDVADKIVSQPRDTRDNPKERIEMKVTLVDKTEAMK